MFYYLVELRANEYYIIKLCSETVDQLTNGIKMHILINLSSSTWYYLFTTDASINI